MSYYSVYRWCGVPECKNTSIQTPNKLWIRVPTDINMRKTWFKVARRDPELLCEKTRLYFCEDHFDLERDMENYIKYKIMGSVKRIRMKPRCIPSRFSWNRKHKCTSNESHLAEAKRQRISKSKDSVKDHIEEDNVKASSSSCIKDPDAGKVSVQHADVLCNNCQNVIVGFRYKCITCEDYNLCKKCEMMETHSEHYVLRIPKPLQREEAAEIVQKLQQVFKPEEDIPLIKEEDPIGDSIGEYRDDEPIQEHNVEGGIRLSKQFKNMIHIEVSRVIDESKDIGEPPATVRRKKKRTAERETGGDGKRMCDADAKVNAAPEIVFADANSDFDTQDSSIKVEVKQEMCEESEIISRIDVSETVNPYVKEDQLFNIPECSYEKWEHSAP